MMAEPKELMMKYIKFALAALAAIFGAQAIAEVVTGTGTPEVQLKFAGPRIAVVRVIDGQSTGIARLKIENGYAEGEMDAVAPPGNRVHPNWGRVELSVGCFIADVAVYKNLPNGGEHLTAAVQMVTERCDDGQ